jgi:hypothetical protein
MGPSGDSLSVSGTAGVNHSQGVTAQIDGGTLPVGGSLITHAPDYDYDHDNFNIVGRCCAVSASSGE